MGRDLRLGLILIVAALSLPQAAVADQTWKTNNAIFNVRDKCARQAQQAYPDYTPESNAKREKMRKNCLLGNNLPVEGGSLPPQTPTPNPPQQ
jgi:hypothetical protein